jgi:subtilase family serine protease
MKTFNPSSRLVVIAACMLLNAQAFAQPVTPLKMVRNNLDGSQTLLNHVPRDVASARKMFHANASQSLDFRVILPSKDEAGMDNFINQLYDPKSPNYHKFLTPAQFSRLFGASTTDSAAVVNYLKSWGLTVRSQSQNGFVIAANGPLQAVESAFKVHINHYQKTDGTTFYSTDADPTLPPQLAGKVTGIAGMDNVARFFPHIVRKGAVRGNATLRQNAAAAALSPAPRFLGHSGDLGPPDVMKAFNVQPINTAGINGSGQTVAVFELDGYVSSDITTFEDNYNIPHVSLSNVLVDGFDGSAGVNAVEVVLDIDMFVSVAPNLQSLRVYEAANSGTSWIDLWNRIASDNLASVISCSWGLFEGAFFASYDHSVYGQLAAQGQSVFASSGDAGAFDNCPNGNPSCGGAMLSVDDPASDPRITSVGITILTENGDGTYNSETTSKFSGGGVSSFVSVPAYQTTAAANYFNATGKGDATKRNVPDTSFPADFSADQNGNCASCWAIFVQADQGWIGVGGSSASAPLWAGFTALVDQGRQVGGLSPIGLLNPTLYTLAQGGGYANDFHDITTGDNSFYPAAANYDAATGLGSFNGLNLFNDLVGALPPSNLKAQVFAVRIGRQIIRTGVTLTWLQPPGSAAQNKIYRSIASGPFSLLATINAASSYIDRNVTRGTLYSYRVTAAASGRESQPSNTVSITF